MAGPLKTVSISLLSSAQCYPKYLFIKLFFPFVSCAKLSDCGSILMNRYSIPCFTNTV